MYEPPRDEKNVSDRTPAPHRLLLEGGNMLGEGRRSSPLFARILVRGSSIFLPAFVVALLLSVGAAGEGIACKIPGGTNSGSSART